jgi:4-hydroxy-2-oxoglutarate aldolase
MRDLHGIFPPIATTFTSSGDVDTRAIGANVQKWMRTRLAGILALGSNGEAPLLDEDESERVIAAVREAVPRDRVLLAGTGRESTKATIAATRRAASLGADAVLVRTPSTYKNQMTADALVAHYRAVADASPVPVLLYNLPGVTGIVLTPAIVATLAAHPNVTGLKETSPDLERLSQFTQIGQLAVMCGWAPVLFPALMAGAAGGILAVANVLPNECVELFEHHRQGRFEEARTLQRRLTPLAQLVTATYGIAGLKVAMDLAGYQGGPVRTPLLAVSPQARAQIEAALTAVHGAVLE